MTGALLLGIVVFCGILIPFLYNEIRKGKVELGPELKETSHGVEFGAVTPTGSGDNHAGSRANPAPGQPDAQADPYDRQAQHGAPNIKS
jgi:hypothetical protein